MFCVYVLFYVLFLLCFSNTHPTTHPSPRSSFWVLASLKRCIHSFLSPASLFQTRVARICNSSLWTTFARLFLGFPTDFLFWNSLLKFLFGGMVFQVYAKKPSKMLWIELINRRKSDRRTSVFCHYEINYGALICQVKLCYY